MSPLRQMENGSSSAPTCSDQLRCTQSKYKDRDEDDSCRARRSRSRSYAAMSRFIPRLLLHSRLVLFVILLASSLLHANVTLPDIIGDSMVLQRDRAVPVWGKADPGEVVRVRFGNQTNKTTADKDGQWRVNLDALHANSTPATMTISGKNNIELKNILVGEVWLVSGQSNMQFTLAESKDGDAAVAAADHPLIRLFNVSRQVAFKHRSGPLGTWQASTPASAKDFSAAGYYFGVELEKELHVPIGLIDSSYGGSQAEAWTPIEYLRTSDDLRPCIEREKTWDEQRPKVKAE